MADAASQQLGQACSGRLTEGTDQIVAIEVQLFFLFNPASLSHSA
jgi:hypothetical protein